MADAASVLEQVDAPLAEAVREDIRKEMAAKIRYLSPEFVLEVALGVEDDYDVAERYGYSREQYDVLAGLKPFQVAVKKTRSDLDKNGDMFRAKARIMAESVMDSGFAKAIDATTPLKETTEFLKTLANLADLVPKAALAAQAGPGFSISIVLPEVDRKTIEITEKAKAEALSAIEGEGEVRDAVIAIELPEEKDSDEERRDGEGRGPHGAAGAADGQQPDGGERGGGAGRDGGGSGDADGRGGGEAPGGHPDPGHAGGEGASEG